MPNFSANSLDGKAPRFAVELSDVTKIYESGVAALGPLDLRVAEGKFVSLLSLTGCGKSTALRLIAGPTMPTKESVALAPRAGVTRPGSRELNHIGFVFQEPTLTPWTSVSHNAGSGLAYCIAESGYRLNIPRMFAALFLLSVAGIVIYGLLALISHPVLRRWHESALGKDN